MCSSLCGFRVPCISLFIKVVAALVLEFAPAPGGAASISLRGFLVGRALLMFFALLFGGRSFGLALARGGLGFALSGSSRGLVGGHGAFLLLGHFWCCTLHTAQCLQVALWSLALMLSDAAVACGVKSVFLHLRLVSYDDPRSVISPAEVGVSEFASVLQAAR